MTNPYIDTLYRQILTDTTLSQKAETYYHIIFIKNAEHINDYYVDIKEFIKFYVQSVDEKNYNYDNINSQKIKNCIELLGVSERIKIYLYLKKVLTKYNSEDLWDDFEDDYYHSKNEDLTRNDFWFLNPVKVMRFLFFKSFYSIPFLIFLITLVLFLEYFILLPNPYKIWPSLFSVEYESVTENFYLNHLFNLLLGFFEIETDFKIVPVSFLGVVF